MDTFNSPAAAMGVDAQAPAIAEWTRTADAGDCLVVSGWQLTDFAGVDGNKDTRFTVYGQTITGDAVTADCEIVSIDVDLATVVLPSDLPTWSTYMLWAGNEEGYGSPVLVNATEGWWVGPDHAAPGTITSVYGRNLSHDNGTSESWVYIQPQTGQGKWATVTAVNPYKVDFVVPFGLADGGYEVWVHNGHGGQYGWSKAGTLTVYDGPRWDLGTTINVKSCGATGNGSTNDASAIQAAINAADENDTIYFPSGTYMVGAELNLTNNIRLLGDGINSTFIKASAAHSSGNLIDGSQVSNVEFTNLSIDANSNLDDTAMVYLNHCTEVRFTDVRLKSPDQDLDYPFTRGVDAISNVRTFFTGCEIIGPGIYLESSEQTFFDSCDFYGTNRSGWLIGVGQAGRGLSLTNSTAQDWDDSDPNSSLKMCGGRWISSGHADGVYFGNNQSIDVSAPDGANAGEQFLWETVGTLYLGSPVSTTSSTLTFVDEPLSTDSGRAPDTRDMVSIVDGKGVGQVRAVKSYNPSTKTIAIEGEWNVTPDSDSTIAWARKVYRTVVYNNTLDAKEYSATSGTHNASTGIMTYTGAADFVVDGNTITQCRAGISLWGNNADQSHHGNCAVEFFNTYINNTIEDARTGIQFVENYAPDAGYKWLGNVFRDNVVTGTILTPIAIGTEPIESGQTRTDAWCGMTVFERNTVMGSSVGMSIQGEPHSVTNTILVDNNFSLGTGTSTGSRGIILGVADSAVLLDNTWTGYQTDYVAYYPGELPGAILEVPHRVLSATAEPGGLRTLDLTVRNAGTDSLTWSVAENADWLTILPSAGTIAAEGVASAQVTFDASGLCLGVYTADITFAGGIKVTAELIVEPDGGTDAGTPVVYIQATDSVATEAGATTGELTVYRTTANGALTVYYSVGGTAAPGSDYVVLSGFVVLAEGAHSAKVSVAPVDDSAAEGLETVTLTLSASAAYGIYSELASGTVAVLDDDALTVTVAATDSSASEQGSATGTFTVSRGAATSGALTVYYDITGTATAGSDYAALAGSVVIPNGQTQATITLTPVNDSANELDETVTIVLREAAGPYNVGSASSASVTIQDNDSLRTHLKMDNGSGSTATDSSTFGNNGTLVGSPTWITSTPSTTGYALDFNGSNYVTLGSASSLDIGNNLTFTFWVKGDNPDIWDRVLQKGSQYGGLDVMVYNMYDGITVRVNTGGGAGELVLKNVFDGQWHHHSCPR